jgi:hypothetical protein
VVCDYFSYSSTRYANVCDCPHRHRATPQCVVLPSELIDHSPGTDMVYLLQNQLVFEQSKVHFHLLRNFDLKDSKLAHHQSSLAYGFWDNSYVGS